MGSLVPLAKAAAGLPIMVSPIEMISSPLVICGKAEYSASRNARQPCSRRRGDRDAHRPPRAQHLRPVRHRQADCGREGAISITSGAVSPHRHQHRAIDARGIGRTGRRGARPNPHPHRRGAQPGAERGEHMGRPSKLTDAQIVEARQRRAKGATLAELARSYGVGKSTISRL
jgi:hypothetical protein